MRMLAAHGRVAAINEPLIGAHLAPFFPDVLGGGPLLYPELMRDREQYFFSDERQRHWRGPLRELILGRLGAELDRRIGVVKEPNGSQAAPQLMSLLPASRMIFLLRDGRDVVDSELAAYQPGAWMADLVGRSTEPDRERVIEYSAAVWLARIERIERAYEAHPSELRYRLTYERLREDPLVEMRSIFDWLELDVPDGLLASIVEQHDFERAGDRGELSFNRAAEPGLWQQNLSASEQRVMGRILDHKLSELGYR